MNIKVNGTSVTITEGMNEFLEDKLSSLERVLEDGTNISVKVTSMKKHVNVVLMVVYNHKVVKVEEKDTDYYVAVDKVVDVLKRKINKLHTLKVKREKDQEATIRKFFTEEVNEVEEGTRIVKRKQVDLKPMTEKDAMFEMESLGHSSFLFLNAEMNCAACLLYRRNDGHYGIIEAI